MIGVDIIRVERIKGLAAKDKNNKVFTKKEREYADLKVGEVNLYNNDFSPVYRTLAGMYAAKEAFLKAIGTGIGGELSLSDIEILHDEMGKPFISKNEKIQNMLLRKAIIFVDLSISHDGEYAIAVVELLKNR